MQPGATRRRHLRGGAVALLATIFGLSGCAIPGQRTSPTSTVEAETLRLSGELGKVVYEPGASSDEALRFFGNGTARREVDLRAARSLSVRARGEACDGDPTLKVSIDGEVVLDAPVRSDKWSTYRADVEVEEGRHDVSIAFLDDLSAQECDRALVVDRVDFGRERGGQGDGEETDPYEEVFEADFSDGISEYPYVIHRDRIRVVDDPVLGEDRKVLRFRVFNSDTGPTENPRAQIETPYDFREGDDRFFGVSFFFPEDFPDELPDRAWVTLGEQSYGPPFAMAAGVSLRVQNVVEGEGLELRWQRNETYDNDIPWHGPRISDIRGRWVDVVQRIRLDRDPERGFVELWMNTGDGLERQSLFGQDRLYMNTYDAAADDGPNNSRLSLYYTREIDGPLTLYHGAHKIVTAGRGALEAVDPRSYDR